MNNKKFFIIFTISSLISMLTTFIMIGYFDFVAYGQYNLYLSYLAILALFSLGYQDGVLLNYRKKNISENYKTLRFEVVFMSIFQIFIFSVTLFVCLFMKLDNIIIYAVLAMLPSIIITILKNIFQATNNLIVMSMVDFVLKLITLFGLIFVIKFKLDMNYYLLMDIVIKYVITFIFVVYLFSFTKKFNGIEQISKICKKSILKNFRIGFLVMLGNWILVILYAMDKLFLKGNEFDLGLYSVAMSGISIFITLLLPIRTIFLTSVNTNITVNEIHKLVKVLNIIGIFLALIYNFVLLPIVIYFNLFLDYKEALLFLGILCILIPVILNVQIILSNLLIIKYNKYYAIINFVLLIIFYFVFTICVSFNGVNIFSIVAGLFVNFLIQYLVYIVLLMKFEKMMKELYFMIFWIFGFLTTLFFGFVVDIVFIIVVNVYIFNNFSLVKDVLKKEE